jgi:hypothetical protein
MGRSGFRKMVSCVLLVFFPGALFAADSNAAMLYTNGKVWVNGANVPRTSSAIFAGDMLQTPAESVANINTAGSNITVHVNSLVDFEGRSVKVEHGGVTVSTAKGIAASAGGVNVAPASASWTEFNVTDVDGTVRIAARKGDVTISDESGTTTLAQGQETTRQETQDNTDQSNAKDSKDSKKKNKKRAAGATPAAGGGVLNSPIAMGVGAAAVAGVATWVLLESNNPASPSAP